MRLVKGDVLRVRRNDHLAAAVGNVTGYTYDANGNLTADNKPETGDSTRNR